MRFFRRYNPVDALRFDGSAESARALHTAFPTAVSRHFVEDGVVLVALNFGNAEVKPGQWVARSVFDSSMHIWDDSSFHILHDAA